MAAPTTTNPGVVDRSSTAFFAAPIGLNVVLENPVFLSDLPTVNPAVPGQLWNNAGVVTQSQ